MKKTSDEKRKESRGAVPKTRAVEFPPRSGPTTRLHTSSTVRSRFEENPTRRNTSDASPRKVTDVKILPPLPATQESVPVDDVLYQVPDKVVSHTVSTTDGEFASGIRFAPNLIARSDNMFCPTHSDRTFKIPYFFENKNKNNNNNVETFNKEYLPNVNQSVLMTLKYMKKRRDQEEVDIPQQIKQVDNMLFGESYSDNDIAHLVLRAQGLMVNNQSVRLSTEGIAINIPVETNTEENEHKCYACYDKAYRYQRRTNVDYTAKYHNITGTEIQKYCRMKMFNTVIYAPEYTGKTTLCTMLNYSGYKALECNNIFEWPDNTNKSLLLTSRPENLKMGMNKICIKPDCDTFYRRQQLRKNSIPHYKMRDYTVFNNLPDNTVVIKTNQMLVELFM